MTSKIDGVIRETRAALGELLGIKEAEKIDLSYITDEIIEIGDEQSKIKDPDAVEEELNQDVEPLAFCYWGNNLYRSGGRWRWTNSNPSSGCDHSGHMCGSGHRWNVSRFRSGPHYLSCGNGKGGAFKAN